MLRVETKAEARSRYKAILLQNALQQLNYQFPTPEAIRQLMEKILPIADMLVEEDEKWAEREMQRGAGL